MQRANDLLAKAAHHRFLWVRRGELAWVGDQCSTIRMGEALYLAPGSAGRIAASPGSRCAHLHFDLTWRERRLGRSGGLFEAVDANPDPDFSDLGLLPPPMRLGVRQAAHVSSAIADIEALPWGRNPWALWRANHRLAELIQHLCADADMRTNEPVRTTAADMARRRRISRSTLYRRFRADGQTPSRRAADDLDLRAMRLLADADMPVYEVAARLRYSSTEAFIHAFRRRHGLPPGRWKKLILVESV